MIRKAVTGRPSEDRGLRIWRTWRKHLRARQTAQPASNHRVTAAKDLQHLQLKDGRQRLCRLNTA